MKKLSTLIIIVVVICLLGLWIGYTVNGNQITIFKKEKKETYRTIAYKNKISETTAMNIKDIIHSDEWVKGEEEQSSPDYKFYFNLYSLSEKRKVYLVRIKNEIVMIQPENEYIYLTLNKSESREMLDFLKSF